ncbi:MAG: HNH endonuclease, partial [Elusimicrobiota bacterium]
NDPITKGKKAPWHKGNEYWKQRKHTPSGEEIWNWKGGITPVKKKFRDSPKYKKWRKEIFKRDNYTCQDCEKRGGYLEVHHIKRVYKIFEENNIKNFKEALNCKELWNKDNGITLCKECHTKTKNGNNKLNKK